MKTSSKRSSKNKNKETIKTGDLKNISGGRLQIPNFQIDPADIKRVLDERKKN